MSVPSGTLYYLIGPSGAGKDSLLAALPRHLEPDAPVAIARRAITRPADATGEDHLPLDREAFRERQAQGAFALSWESHGCLYGIGIEVDQWLARGTRVLVNGSRGALERAQDHWGKALTPVVVRVDADVLAQRLQRRGREDGHAIHQRLDRARALGEPAHPRRLIIDNNGPLDQAAARLAALVAGRGSACS
ncbi:MAG: phosphonate metabolism protein/1,5-bisphosphokinase (PRPP-forming) PhnN [Ectothiorhodospiraceae bacterium]